MTLFILHAASALFMTGLVWFVQIVHYPLLHHVGTTSFHHYEADHTRRTSPVVAPVMLFELASGVWLALAPPTGVESTLLLANAVLLAVIWGSTFVLQTPLHRQLWTVRSALLVFVLLALTEPSPTPTRKPLPDVPSLPPIQGVLLK